MKTIASECDEGIALVMHGHRQKVDQSERAIVFCDPLVIGPVSIEQSIHSRLRARFWNDIYRSLGRAIDFDTASESVSDEAIKYERRQLVYLRSTQPTDILSFCRVCWMCRDCKKKLNVVDIESYGSSEIVGFAERSRQVPRDELEMYASCWESFACGQFDRLVQPGRLPLDVRCALRSVLTTVLPQVDSSGELRLSQLDKAILQAFEDKGALAYNCEIVAGCCIQHSWVPELALFGRLERWNTTILQRVSAEAWNRAAFQLTTTGSDVLHGNILGSLGVLEWWLGGARTYLHIINAALVEIDNELFAYHAIE